ARIQPSFGMLPPFRKYGTVELSTPGPAPDGHFGHQHYNCRANHPGKELLTVPSHPESHDFRNPLSLEIGPILVENRRAFLRFLTHRSETTDMAEEVLHEFYLRALSKSSDIKKRDSVQQWLYRVLRSTLADYYRAKMASQHGKAEYARLQPTFVNEFTLDPEAVCECFYRLIPTLRPEYAVVLKRIDLRGESRAIVAEDLGITLTLLRVRLHRARQALKHALLASCKDCCPEHGFLNCECAHEARMPH
ncbi:MAG: sigma-70 family RNA polymerase sigma factor, partial [Candidatus Omnitrophota bacterium]